MFAFLALSFQTKKKKKKRCLSANPAHNRLNVKLFPHTVKSLLLPDLCLERVNKNVYIFKEC